MLDMTRVYPFVQRARRATHRPELSGAHHAGREQGRHHSRPHLHAGHVGVVSRSGTLTYEVVYQLTRAGIGQSTCVGIGGDPINGTNFIDCARGVRERSGDEGDRDDGRDRRHGRAGGGALRARAHEEARRRIHRRPDGAAGRRMGHAGAIISGSAGTAAEKIEAFEKAGMGVARRPKDFVELLRERL